MFSNFGVVFVIITLLLGLAAYIVTIMVRGRLKLWKVIVSTLIFLLLAFITPSILLYSFPEPSQVDVSPLERIGDQQIVNFDSRQLVLENSNHFLRKNRYAYNYRFRFPGEPTVYLTIYTLANQETAYDNLVISADSKTKNIRQLSETVYLYAGDSVFFRSRDSHMSDDLRRQVKTNFIIGNILFMLTETGNREIIGNNTSIVVQMIYDIFID